MKLLFIIFISISFSQVFDPETGKLIIADTTKVEFDPITGEKSISPTILNNKEYKQPAVELSSFEIRLMAQRDVIKYFDEEMKIYKFLGGPASAITIVPLAMLGLSIGFLLGGDESALPALGFWGGAGFGILGIPKLMANIDSSKPILLELEHIKSLSSEQKQTYLNEFSIELKKKRVSNIRKGQLGVMGLTVAFPIMMTILFGF